MNSIAFGALALLGVVVFRNLVDGTLGAWFLAKAFNRSPGAPVPPELSFSTPGSSAGVVSTPLYPGKGTTGKVTGQEVAFYAVGAGLTSDAATIAVAVARAESGWRAAAIGDSGASIGLWQIHMPSHPRYSKETLLDPRKNAAAMYQISNGGRSWEPWTTYRNGSYLAYMTEAAAAVAEVSR